MYENVSIRYIKMYEYDTLKEVNITLEMSRFLLTAILSFL